MENRVTELRMDMFSDIIIFSFSEPGAMGPNDATYYKRNGEYFSVDYKWEKTPYKELREVFPLMKECRWFGPMKSELLAAPTIVIGGSKDDPETRVPEGWRHIYLDYGNHIAVKSEYYNEVKRIFSEYDNCEITFEWPQILDNAKFAEIQNR